MADPFHSLQIDLRLGSAQKIRIAVGGVLVLIAIGIGVGIWLWRTHVNFKTLAPVDTVVYAEFTNGNWLSKKWLSGAPFTPWYEALNQTMGRDFDFSSEVANVASAGAVIMIPDQIHRTLVPVVLLKGNHRQLQPLERFSHRWVGRNILAISSAESGLDAINNVSRGQALGLATQVDLNRQLGNPFVFYVNFDALKTYAVADGFMADVLKSQLSGRAVIRFIPASFGWRLTVDTNVPVAGNISATEVVVPPQYYFAVTPVNLSELFFQWAGVNKELATMASQVDATARSVFNFDIAKSLAGMFNQPGAVIVGATSPDLIGRAVVIALPTPSAEQLSSFERLVSIFFAQRLPVRVTRVLPDQTTVTELRLRSDEFAWQGDAIRIFEVPQVDVRLAYTKHAGQLWLSNSPELLEQLAASTRTLAAAAADCGLPGTGSTFAFQNAIDSRNQPSLNFLPTGTMVFEAVGARINGCLIVDK